MNFFVQAAEMALQPFLSDPESRIARGLARAIDMASFKADGAEQELIAAIHAALEGLEPGSEKDAVVDALLKAEISKAEDEGSLM
jgi:hypothetical protein